MAGQRIKKEEAKELVQKFPWFSYGHLSEFTSIDLNDPEYSRKASVTLLHYPDPVLLDHLIKKLRPGYGMDGIPGNSMPGAEKDMRFVPGHDTVSKDEEVAGYKTQAPEPGGKTEVIPEDHKPGQTDIHPVQEAHLATEPVLSETKDITFEPLHTTDYFASQGIKLSEEQQSGDKLGKQMKSFTAWLKTMKKVHHGKDLPPEDITVKIIAEKSNLDEEVVTESMAEVYASQGKTEKAREIYHKLSLINPAKSAYFAQKIDLLNN